MDSNHIQLLPTNAAKPSNFNIHVFQSILAVVSLLTQVMLVIFASTSPNDFHWKKVNELSPLMLSCNIVLAIQAICVLVALCTGRWRLPFHNFPVHVVSLGLSIANAMYRVCGAQSCPVPYTSTYVFVVTISIATLQFVMSVILAIINYYA